MDQEHLGRPDSNARQGCEPGHDLRVVQRAEGFLDVKGSQGNPHKIIITLSNLFTTPLATGIPFNWRDITPVKMLALDNFVLWVNAATPYKTPKAYIDAVKKAGPGKMKMGGTGSKQEDQIITASYNFV